MFKLMSTFGLTGATAGTIATAIMFAFKDGSLSLGRVVLLLAGTGIGAIVLVSIFAVGISFIAKKAKMGHGAVKAW